jgi:hypothetical protein
MAMCALDSGQRASPWFRQGHCNWNKVPMPVFTIAILAVIVAIVTALAVAVGWAQLHARPANNLPAPISNAGRPRRRPF